jgi:hypothetical protein
VPSGETLRLLVGASPRRCIWESEHRPHPPREALTFESKWADRRRLAAGGFDSNDEARPIGAAAFLDGNERLVAALLLEDEIVGVRRCHARPSARENGAETTSTAQGGYGRIPK